MATNQQLVAVILVAFCLIARVSSQTIVFTVLDVPRGSVNIPLGFGDCSASKTATPFSGSLLLQPPITIEVTAAGGMGNCAPDLEGIIVWYGNSTHYYGVTLDAISTLRVRSANGGAPNVVTIANHPPGFRVVVSVASATSVATFILVQAAATADLTATTINTNVWPTFTAPTGVAFGGFPFGGSFKIGTSDMGAFSGAFHAARVFSGAKSSAQALVDAKRSFRGDEPGLLHNWKLENAALTDDVAGGFSLTAPTTPASVTLNDLRANNFFIVPERDVFRNQFADVSSQSLPMSSSNFQATLQNAVMTSPSGDITFPTGPNVLAVAGIATFNIEFSRRSCVLGSSSLVITPAYTTIGLPAINQNTSLFWAISLKPSTLSFVIPNAVDPIQLKSSVTGGLGISAALATGESVTLSYRNSTFSCTTAGVAPDGSTLNCQNTGLPGFGNATVTLCGQSFTVPFTFPVPTIFKINAVNDGILDILGTGFGKNRTFVAGIDTFSISGPKTPNGELECVVTVVTDTLANVVCPNPTASLVIGSDYTVLISIGGLAAAPSKFNYQICTQACVNGRCTGRDFCTCNPGFSGATCADKEAPIAAIAAPVAVGGVALIAAAIVGVIAYRRYKNPKRGGKTFIPLEKKDFTKIIYGDSLLNNPSGKAAGDLLKLETFLLEDNLELAFAIANATQITEADEIAKAMVTIFQANSKVLPLLKAFIGDEVRNSDSSGTLFRSNSFVSKMFKYYSRLIALPYLYTTIGPEINELLEEKVGLEVDPEKIEEGTDLDQMRWTLMAQSQKILKQIMASSETCPDEFKVLFSHLKECVAEKFPEHVNITIGGFIFLRFFCPAISSPEAYGLSEEPPSQECRRLLILITKVLQNLSNDVEFGSKEMYMTKMNDFIQVNRGKISNFYKKLMESANNSATPIDMPRTARNAALHILGSHLKEISPKITDESSKKKVSEILA